MVMKFSRAYCDQLKKTLSPYQARELYTDEDGDHFGQQLIFSCEDERCRARLTPVGIYMTRKSKRALHFRTKDEHTIDCGFLESVGPDGKPRKPSDTEDDYKLTDFPTELDLNPRKRKSNGGGVPPEDFDGDGDASGGGSASGGGGKRQTRTRTRYLDLVVDCFLSGDENGKQGQFTIEGKTKPFGRFFKKVQYFGDEAGLIYYGNIDDLKRYNGKGIGLRFSESVWVEKKRYRLWVHIPQERIDESRRKKAFLSEIEELQIAVKAGEEVIAFFVGAYPTIETVEKSDGSTFDLYRAELSSIDHLSLAFAK
jgi:hypothetical protein